MVLKSIQMDGPGIRFQTTNGTIDENTSPNDLQLIFLLNSEDVSKERESKEHIFMIPAGEGGPDSWKFYFSPNGKPQRIIYFIPC